MQRTTRIERRKRGFFGWVFLLLFWGFQIFMVWSLVAGLANVGTSAAALQTEAERAGAAIGATLGVGIILSIWAAGSIILGLLMFATRGSKIIIEER
ncbi:MAG: hypothetical protein KDJ98_16700 [Rhodobacteraceae bacterium]|nr:hypothetical protein [Paracoccaceae bacterium]